MKHPYTGFSSLSFGLPKKDLIGLSIIAAIGIIGLIVLFSSPVLFKGNQAATIQPTKHLSASALNFEKTAENTTESNNTVATHNFENTKM